MTHQKSYDASTGLVELNNDDMVTRQKGRCNNCDAKFLGYEHTNVIRPAPPTQAGRAHIYLTSTIVAVGVIWPFAAHYITRTAQGKGSHNGVLMKSGPVWANNAALRASCSCQQE